MKAVRSALVLVIPILTFALAGCEDGSRQQLENQLMDLRQTCRADGVDLSAEVPRHLLVNVEATVGNAKTKVDEVRARTDALTSALRPAYTDAEE